MGAGTAMVRFQRADQKRITTNIYVRAVKRRERYRMVYCGLWSGVYDTKERPRAWGGGGGGRGDGLGMMQQIIKQERHKRKKSTRKGDGR